MDIKPPAPKGEDKPPAPKGEKTKNNFNDEKF